MKARLREAVREAVHEAAYPYMLMLAAGMAGGYAVLMTCPTGYGLW